MSLGSLITGNPPGAPCPPLRRFSVEEYRRMGEAGVLGEDDRVELLDGWIVEKMVHNPPHDATVDLVHEVLRKFLPEGWRIRIQSAITTSDSEPEPDLAVVRGQASTYMNRHPGPPDLGLVIEVADSSLDHDRGLKAGIYARARVARYWIVNLVERRLEVHEDPTGPAPVPVYRAKRIYELSGSVDLVLSEREVARIPVSSLFPTRETA